MKFLSIEKIVAAVIIAVLIMSIGVVGLVAYHYNLSREIDLLPYNQPETIWITTEQDIFIIVPADTSNTQTYVCWNDMYLTATIGGVTRGRQFDLFVDDHYLLAGEFHVQNDCMIVVPENDRPQVSDPAFLAERDEIIFYRYDCETGYEQLPEGILESAKD